MNPITSPTFYSYFQTQFAKMDRPANERYGAHWGRVGGVAVAETLTMLPRALVGTHRALSPQLLSGPSMKWRGALRSGGALLVINKAVISGCVHAGMRLGQGAGALAALLGARCGRDTSSWSAQAASKGAQLGWMVGLLPCGISEIARGTMSLALSALNEAFGRGCGLVAETLSAVAELLFNWEQVDSFDNPLNL